MASSNDNVSMALFCDFENVALGVRDANYDKFDIKPVLERLLLKGSIVVKKAYCDWDRYKGFKAPMHEANFELIEIPHVRQSGKNSADIRMVVDALDLCYTKSHVDTFVIISGDSDFSPLVSKLRENAKKVIGVGVKQSTSDLLVANCDEFIFYDDLVRESRRARRDAGEAKQAVKRSPEEENARRAEMERRRDEAVEIAANTFEALVLERGDSGKIWASVLKEAIKRRKPDFSESYYGFRTFGNLIEECKARGLLEFGRDEKSGAYVYRSSGAQHGAAPALDGQAVQQSDKGGSQEQGAESRRSRNRGRTAAERFAERQAERQNRQGRAAQAGNDDASTAADIVPDAPLAELVDAAQAAEHAGAAAAAAADTQHHGRDGNRQRNNRGGRDRSDRQERHDRNDGGQRTGTDQQHATADAAAADTAVADTAAAAATEVSSAIATMPVVPEVAVGSGDAAVPTPVKKKNGAKPPARKVKAAAKAPAARAVAAEAAAPAPDGAAVTLPAATAVATPAAPAAVVSTAAGVVEGANAVSDAGTVSAADAASAAPAKAGRPARPKAKPKAKSGAERAPVAPAAADAASVPPAGAPADAAPAAKASRQARAPRAPKAAKTPAAEE
ncbi:hypothetical protein ASF61_02940 [Duganella sp. Leaf126]|uniref:NYN domain-containing protein n=1 Tax=Duganella sp. Leaf126 TaxID=1736266 RepID=UPI0006F27194|nr:NYN domain-containing protein [Duganella sp. Leaf126]KQQ47603.1 hypothetical protein ASF61_02940 [Duganella sp. Leaf126]